MATPNLPKTVQRLSTSVTIRLIPQDSINSATLSNPANILTAIKSTPLASVESFDETNDRPAGIRFEMNADAPGVVVEAYPNQVSARTVTLTKVVLYSEDATEAFQITGGDIVQQFFPFALIKVESAPQGANVPTRITVFRNCWFTSNPKAFNVAGGDLKIIQSVSITYAEREVVSLP